MQITYGCDGIAAHILHLALVVDGRQSGHCLQIGDSRVHGHPAQAGKSLGSFDLSHFEDDFLQILQIFFRFGNVFNV